jgi:hypothetical protein
MVNGFNIDWTQSSLFYCKFRVYLFQACMLISLTSLCFATIDQYWATCSRPQWQQWSNIKLARRLSAISVIIWFLHGTPQLIFTNQIVMPSGRVMCKITNEVYQQYSNCVTTLLLGRMVPLSITFIFGLLAYRNVQQLTHRAVPLVRRELDKQLTNMVLIQVVFNCFAVLPYLIMTVLATATNISSNPARSAQFTLAILVTACVYYLYFAVSMNQIY